MKKALNHIKTVRAKASDLKKSLLVKIKQAIQPYKLKLNTKMKIASSYIKSTWLHKKIIWLWEKVLWLWEKVLWLWEKVLWACRKVLWLWEKVLWACRKVLWACRKVLWIFLPLLALITFTLDLLFHNEYDPYLKKIQSESLQNFLISTGAALISGVAIVFAFIIFAMQVNVRSMPYVLFQKFSADTKLIGLFVLMFIIPISIALLSLQDKPFTVLTMMTVFFLLVSILILFMEAYKKTLELINPFKQLERIVEDTKNKIDEWAKVSEKTTQSPTKNEDCHDVIKVIDYAIAHCIYFARKYSKQGDYETSTKALESIIDIHVKCISTKEGKSLFDRLAIIDSDASSENALGKFIRSTPRELRQLAQDGISQNDIQPTNQVFVVLNMLCGIYSQAGVQDIAKNYYLSSAALNLLLIIENIRPRNGPHMLMGCIESIKVCMLATIKCEEFDNLGMLTQGISLAGRSSAADEKPIPVTSAASSELASFTAYLLQNKTKVPNAPLHNLINSAKSIAEACIDQKITKESEKQYIASLAPYYSGMGGKDLIYRLTKIADGIAKASSGDECAERVINHFAQWSSYLHPPHKELFELSVEKRTFFSPILISWIADVTKILLKISRSPACDQDKQGEPLREHALLLTSILFETLNDREVVDHDEINDRTARLFEMALEANNLKCIDFANDIQSSIYGLAIKVGVCKDISEPLSNIYYVLAYLDLLIKPSKYNLLEKIKSYMGSEDSPSPEIRLKTAQNIRKRAEDCNASDYARYFGTNESAIESIDIQKLKTLIGKIADILEPELPLPITG